jgi:hypothetical protein
MCWIGIRKKTKVETKIRMKKIQIWAKSSEKALKERWLNIEKWP